MIYIILGAAMGAICIIISIVGHLQQSKLIKNRIEVEATVIKTGVKYDYGEYGNTYFPVFRYCVNDKWYETGHATMKFKYYEGAVERIYCYTSNPEKIILPEEIGSNNFARAILLVGGICILSLTIYSITKG